MKNSYKIVDCHNEKYVVATTCDNVVFTFDYNFLKKLPNKTFFKTRDGYICCIINNIDVYLHHIIKPLKNKKDCIEHINGIKTDNREVNLRYISQN